MDQNPYEEMVKATARLLREGAAFPLGGFAFPGHPDRAGDAKVLILSPHPDDECIIGGLPLRLAREAHLQVINVAVTLGSNRQRQDERFEELSQACRYLGFGLIRTSETGLEHVNLASRDKDPEAWHGKVEIIRAILEQQRPRIIFYPHAADWNSTHIGTHWLLSDALKRMGAVFSCWIVETEYWAPMADPNLMVESSNEDVARLVTALTFHAGEVRRNPYHLRQTAWMMDNVRRGGELVGGQGGHAPDFAYATLYRARRWFEGTYQDLLYRGKLISQTDSVQALF